MQPYYPHMPIGKAWIYRLLFVFVCTVTDFCGKNKARGVKFCTVWFMGVLGREFTF